MKKSREELVREINEYAANWEKYDQFSRILDKILIEIGETISTEAFIQVRAKEISSFAEKIQRPEKSHLYGENPMEDMDDLCGGRVILPTEDHVAKCCELIEDNFILVEHEDKKKLLDEDQFGYRSHHFTVKLDRKSKYIEGMEIQKEFYSLKAEIQVRSFLAHTWSVVHHDIVYKPKFKIPKKIMRRFNIISALLEETDDNFKNVMEALRNLEKDYVSYMSDQEINEQIKILELVYETTTLNRKKLQFALRIHELARALRRENWDLSIKYLSNHVNSGNPDILRELGMAYRKKFESNTAKENKDNKDFELGRSYCEEAINLDGDNPENYMCLANFWIKNDMKKAFEYIKQAYFKDPDHIYSASRYFVLKIALSSNIEVLDDARPVFKSILKKIENDISLETDMPWAYFNHGLFNLFSNNVEISLNSYLMGIKYSNAGWYLETTLKDLEMLRTADQELEGLNLIIQLITLGLAAKFHDKTSKKSLKNQYGAKETHLNTPLVVIAGTTKFSFDEYETDFKTTLLDAFQSFNGSIISGGTVAGVCEIVGTIQNNNPNSIRTIGYIPNYSNKDEKFKKTIDSRYSVIHKTHGKRFSLLESLQYWTDIVLNNIDLENVKLIGVGGGLISAFEYRLALTLGIKVGILAKSAGSGINLLNDPIWKGENLKMIENNAESVIEFFSNN